MPGKAKFLQLFTSCNTVLLARIYIFFSEVGKTYCLRLASRVGGIPSDSIMIFTLTQNLKKWFIESFFNISRGKHPQHYQAHNYMHPTIYGVRTKALSQWSLLGYEKQTILDQLVSFKFEFCRKFNQSDLGKCSLKSCLILLWLLASILPKWNR